MQDENKREIPRHVDGRVMIGLLPAKTLFKIMPLYILTLIVVMLNLSPVSAFIGTIIAVAITFMFSEIDHRQTGYQVVKDIIRYAKEGDIEFERSCIIRDEDTRVTWNKIQKHSES